MNRRLLPLLLLVLGAAAPAAFAADVYKWTDEKGVVHYGDTPPEGSDATRVALREIRPAQEDPAPAAATPKPEEKPVAPTNQSNCDIARRNLETLVKAPRVEMDSDGDGKPEPLSDEQRAAEQARNEDLVRIYCGGE